MKNANDSDGVKTGLNQIAQESFYTRRQLNKTMRSINIKVSLMLLIMIVVFFKTTDLSVELKAIVKFTADLKHIFN